MLEIRGNKHLVANRFVILIADFLPNPDSTEFEETFDLLNSAEAKTILIAYSHPGLTPEQQTRLESRASTLHKREDLLVWLADSPDGLKNLVTSNLPTVLRDYSLSS